MAEIFILTSVTLIFLLILIQNISIRFLYKNGFSAEIDYSFFTLVLTKPQRKKKRRKMSSKIFLPFKRIAEYWLRRSSVEISEISLFVKDSEPDKFILKYKNLFSLFAATTVYLSRKTKKLTVSDSSITVSGVPGGDTSQILDISVTSPLYVTLFAAAMLFFTILRNKKPIKRSDG